MKTYSCQIDIAWENPAANFERVSRMLEGVSIAPGSLIVLPEMFSTGFSMNVSATAGPGALETESFLRALAIEENSAVLGGVVSPGENPEKGKNEAVLFGPDGSLLARYQKNRTFRYSGECQHYERGGELAVFDWGGIRFCPLICYDLRFPELFRRGVARGVQAFVVIASWPAARVEHWLVLLRARAIENQAWVIGVNRCGQDPNFQYPGASVVIGPQGQMIAEAGEGECCLQSELDLEELLGWRAEFPALEDLEI